MRAIVQDSTYQGSMPFETDLLLGSAEAEEILAGADLFVVTAYMSDDGGGPFKLRRFGRPVARHYSTEPCRWVEGRPQAWCSTVSAQYHHRFAPYLEPLPNCIPIQSPSYSPADKDPDRLTIVYSPSSRKSETWLNKGFDDTVQILRRLEARYGERVRIVILHKVAHDLVLDWKRRAHIVIDECVTGSYHGNGLEGLACGAATFARLDKQTIQAIAIMYADAPAQIDDVPFISCTLKELPDRLSFLIERPQFTAALGARSREWMCRHYSEEWQAGKWIGWHERFLQRARSRARTGERAAWHRRLARPYRKRVGRWIHGLGRRLKAWES